MLLRAIENTAEIVSECVISYETALPPKLLAVRQDKMLTQSRRVGAILIQLAHLRCESKDNQEARPHDRKNYPKGVKVYDVFAAFSCTSAL